MNNTITGLHYYKNPERGIDNVSKRPVDYSSDEGDDERIMII